MTNHNHQKKIALINDYTGFGRCSVAVQLPIISMLKVQSESLPAFLVCDPGSPAIRLHPEGLL